MSSPLPFELKVRSLHASLAPGARSTEHVLVRIDVADRADRARPDLAAVLAVDTSSSMSGVPIDQVRRAAARLADILGDSDSLGLVRFDSDAAVVSEIRELDAAGRRELGRAIEALTARGSTNMAGGIETAAILFPRELGERRAVVLLMSDGQANVGVSSPEGLAKATAALKKRGIGSSTLGFGAHHHEDTLIAIADAGGGRYAYVADPRLADAELARAIGAQRDVVAESVSLLLSPAPGVEIARVLGDPPTSFGAGGLRVQLTDAIAGDQINVVVELSVEAPGELGPWQPLAIEVAGRPLGGEPGALAAALSIDVSRIDGGREADLEVARFAAIARAGEERDRARALADRGNFAAAAQILGDARDAVAATPGFDPEGPLGDVYETLVDDITAMENRPDPEAYAAYRKAQHGYANFAAGGHKGRSQTYLGGTAMAMATAAQSGPLPPARLVARHGGVELARFALEKPDLIVGRGGGNDVVVLSPSLSRRHTRIKLVDGRFWIFDLGSTNGTVVNGEPVLGGVALSDGDVVSYGDVELIYEEDDER